MSKAIKIDEDSEAFQVSAFLRAMEMDPTSCACENEGIQKGRNLLQDHAHALLSGEERPLTPNEAANVLDYVVHVTPREGAEGLDKGGAVKCGFNHIMWWVASQLREHNAEKSS